METEREREKKEREGERNNTQLTDKWESNRVKINERKLKACSRC